MKATLSRTSGLADRARQLGEIMDSMMKGNGNELPQTTAKPKTRRAKKASAADERE